MKKVFTIVLVALLMLSLVACGKEGVSDSKDTTKGTRENPYTMEDTITVSCYAWDGNRMSGGTPIGTNTFELSNFRIESGELSGYQNKTKNVNVFVFDKECIETCYEDGLNWLDTGDISVNAFFNSNMQSMDYTDITQTYTNQDSTSVIYFEGTTYTEAYAMCDMTGGEVITNDEIYSLMRILYYDENLDEQYVYISLETDGIEISNDSVQGVEDKAQEPEIDLITTAEDVMDTVDKYIVQEGLSDFTYNKNDFESVFVTGPSLSTVAIDPDRKVSVYPEIHINHDPFSITDNYPNGKYGVSSLRLRFEYSDKSQDMHSRHSLNADKITISSDTSDFTNVFSGIPDSDSQFEQAEYLSKFSYTLKPDDVEKLASLLHDGSIIFTVDTVTNSYDYDELQFVKTPYTFEYAPNKNDVDVLTRTLNIYHYLLDTLGSYW